MLHYNQAMILNADNDRLLCKVILASLRGPALVIGRKRDVYICTPMCASARVASSNIMISEYRSHGELGY